MTKGYHHKNLKGELLTQAIEMIASSGIEQLSLRQLALKCQVSHNAIYRHFENKEALLNSCVAYVADIFAHELKSAIKGMDAADPTILAVLGTAYIQFFRDHPTYYQFIYQNATCSIRLTLDNVEGNYPPFEVFREVCEALCRHHHVSKEEGLRRLISCWSFVQGVSSLIISPNIQLEGNWDAYLEKMFTCI